MTNKLNLIKEECNVYTNRIFVYILFKRDIFLYFLQKKEFINTNTSRKL